MCVRRRRAVGDRRGRRHRRTGGGPVAAAAATVVGARSRHGVHRTDAGAGRDLAVARVRKVVSFTGWEERTTWRKGKEEEFLKCVYTDKVAWHETYLGATNSSLLPDFDFYRSVIYNRDAVGMPPPGGQA